MTRYGNHNSHNMFLLHLNSDYKYSEEYKKIKKLKDKGEI